MADYSTITLAGGIKAPRQRFAEPRPALATSPAFAAFEKLNDALADACAAEEFRMDPASWDLAHCDPDAASEDAVNLALELARAAGNASIVLAPDRMLVFVARFIHCAIGMESEPDRINMLHLLESSQTLWNRSATGLIARRADELVSRAIERLVRLTDLLYGTCDDAVSPAP